MMYTVFLQISVAPFQAQTNLTATLISGHSLTVNKLKYMLNKQTKNQIIKIISQSGIHKASHHNFSYFFSLGLSGRKHIPEF